jgi:hypothetical protein
VGKFGEDAPRFFGAAADVLDERLVGSADGPGALVNGLSAETDAFLRAANQYLFLTNAEVYTRLMNGGDLGPMNGLKGRDFDLTMVRLEQGTLQKFMVSYFRGNSEGLGAAINDLNGAFNSRANRFAIGNLLAGRVLNGSFPLPDSRFDFGNPAHRIAIGQGVVNALHDGTN